MQLLLHNRRSHRLSSFARWRKCWNTIIPYFTLLRFIFSSANIYQTLAKWCMFCVGSWSMKLHNLSISLRCIEKKRWWRVYDVHVLPFHSMLWHKCLFAVAQFSTRAWTNRRRCFDSHWYLCHVWPEQKYGEMIESNLEAIALNFLLAANSIKRSWLLIWPWISLSEHLEKWIQFRWTQSQIGTDSWALGFPNNRNNLFSMRHSIEYSSKIPLHEYRFLT